MQLMVLDFRNLHFLHLAKEAMNFYKAIWIDYVKNLNLRGFSLRNVFASMFAKTEKKLFT